MPRLLPFWRNATWALLIFTAWMILITVMTASLAPAVLWLIGLFVVVILWLASRSKLNVPIYGPAGRKWIVSAATAERRVRNGWTYQPQATRP
jgi:hypothetical protein